MFNYKSYHISLPSKRMAYNNFFWETIYANYFKYIFSNIKRPKLKLENLLTEDFFLGFDLPASWTTVKFQKY